MKFFLSSKRRRATVTKMNFCYRRHLTKCLETYWPMWYSLCKGRTFRGTCSVIYYPLISVFVRHVFVRHLPNFFCCFAVAGCNIILLYSGWLQRPPLQYHLHVQIINKYFRLFCVMLLLTDLATFPLVLLILSSLISDGKNIGNGSFVLKCLTFQITSTLCDALLLLDSFMFTE